MVLAVYLPGVRFVGHVQRRRTSQYRHISTPATAFLQPKRLKPPVIDAQRFLAKEKDLELPPFSVAEQLAAAGSEFGCFQLVNHGVDEVLQSSLQVGRQADQAGGVMGKPDPLQGTSCNLGVGGREVLLPVFALHNACDC